MDAQEDELETPQTESPAQSAQEPQEAAQLSPENSQEEKPLTPVRNLPKKRILEAALFLANRPMRLDGLAALAQCDLEDAEGLLTELAEEMEASETALRLTKMEDPNKLAGPEYKMELKDEYVPAVANLSGNVDLNRKALRILALVAKKKRLLQSELKYYFRGDVYDAVDDLVRKGYLKAGKFKTTKELKPTPLFFEHFKSFE